MAKKTKKSSVNYLPWILPLVVIIPVSIYIFFGKSFNFFSSTGKVRTYYIAADEVMWNYAPMDKNEITGEPFTDDEKIYAEPSATTLGSSYKKALYRQYTDGSFTNLVSLPEDQKFLGILGPTIHAEVGDTIKIYFKNNTTMPVSMHPHGVFYQKPSEGAMYNDGTNHAEPNGDVVAPGGQFTYTWEVPDRAGPGPMDPSSIMWMYHSHVDEVKDTNSGLVGSIIVTKRGMARADGTPKDVDREFPVLFSVLNENNSLFLDENVANAVKKVDTEDPDFEEGNLKHSINGYIFGNMPMITMKQGEHVRWYVASMGTETDLHTPHWHGNTVTISGMRTDVAQLLPMGMVTADMTPDNPGIWLFHCHVNDHILAGMLTRYQVLPSDGSAPQDNTSMGSM